MSTIAKKDASNKPPSDHNAPPPHAVASYAKTGATLDRELFDASDELEDLADEIDIAAAATETDLDAGGRDEALGVVLGRIRERVRFVATVVAGAAKRV